MRGPFLLSALVAAVVLFAAIKTVVGADTDFYPPRVLPNWYITPGEWAVPYEIEGPPPVPSSCSSPCTFVSFQAIVYGEKRTCLRYLNPKVIYDGREIPGHIEESGVPGEIGWQWSFQTDEIFTGPFEWHVTTVDVCPKVS